MKLTDLVKKLSLDEIKIIINSNIITRDDGFLTIVKIAYNNPSTLPDNIKGDTPTEIVNKWHQKYSHAYENRISIRKSNDSKTISDEIVNVIIAERLKLSEKNVELIKQAHRLSMAAENILGLLLEDYLANELSRFGWVCCWGSCLKSIDFCNQNGDLLQVKNRSNTENSSSKRVRDGTKISKWFRINASNGRTQWEQLDTLIGTSNFTESKFVNFVRTVIRNNPNAFALDTNNIWLKQP